MQQCPLHVRIKLHMEFSRFENTSLHEYSKSHKAVLERSRIFKKKITAKVEVQINLDNNLYPKKGILVANYI